MYPTFGQPVTLSEIESSTPALSSVSGTAGEILSTRLGKARRSFLSIIPISAGVTVTLAFGDVTAVANTGLPLIQNQPFTQSLDINGRGVYQGAIQAVASGAGQVAIVEIFEQ